MVDDADPALAQTADSQPAAPSPSSHTPPKLIANRYEIETLLGAGGMGRVYRAKDRTLDEVVALKILRRELLATEGVAERFRQEVKLARRVTSPHVVRTFDLGEHHDEQFITMEYIEGQSLARLLVDAVPSLTEALRIARAACAGMAAAHEAGVLHRDLKPDNVLVGVNGRVAITDFGIARPADSATTTHDRFVGTPAYMAPEQVRGTVAIGPYTDVYSFGAILFEMLTGRRPFVGQDALAVAVARLDHPAPDPRSIRPVPDALAAIVLACMARDASARYRDGRQLAEVLASVRPDGPTELAASPQPIVPAVTSPAIAVLPLRAGDELAELGSGLTEEIVDALSMTRSLRVRPLLAVRRAAIGDRDGRELGAELGVDVIVEGSLRRHGDLLRVAARAISVADGFQLWANRFESRPEKLLEAGDEIARAVAAALTVVLSTPERGTADARATAHYLEGKAKMRHNWYSGGLLVARRDLETALELAPDDPAILAALALALARLGFFNDVAELPLSRALAERAVSLSRGRSGEPWLALGLASLYAGEYVAAARATLRSVTLGPGLALAQATLGAIALEAGILDDAIAHLESAFALDPGGPQGGDLSRAYIYAGRFDDGLSVLRRAAGNAPYVESQLARFTMWQGRVHDYVVPTVQLPGDFGRWLGPVARIHRTRTMTEEDREILEEVANATNERLRASRWQFLAEYNVFVGDHPRALAAIQRSVDAGLVDTGWLQYCPMLAPLRGSPAFERSTAIVAERARPVREALHDRANLGISA
ncbi:MAG: protein kinase [Kofleriaceae bacterium]